MITADLIPRITRASAPAIAAEEYRRLLVLLDGLDPDDWAMPTDCDAWDVRAMVAHLVGAAESCASLREQLHQTRRARVLVRTRGIPLVDALSETQVRERDGLPPRELVSRLARSVPAAVRGRRRLPGFLRGVDVGDDVVGPLPLGWLMDVIYTRDTWMHRVDITRATGRPMELTPGHDGAIVADVVADWAQLHGAPFELDLLGPAGGRFHVGEGGWSCELDAVEFCRVVSGRASGDGLLATRVLF